MNSKFLSQKTRQKKNRKIDYGLCVFNVEENPPSLLRCGTTYSYSYIS